MLKSLDTRMPHSSSQTRSASPAQSQPLGALLIFKRNKAWFEAHPETRTDSASENTRIAQNWEKRLGGKIYKIYGFEWGQDEAWEYFSLLEFADLEVWQQLQQQLDGNGFSDQFTWEIVALGRRTG